MNDAPQEKVLKKTGPKSRYNPDFCDIVVSMMKEGASKEEVCLELDICYNTMRRWEDENPEFKEAVRRGVDFAQAWWYREGRLNLSKPSFNHQLWFLNMKNRHAWADRRDDTLKHQYMDKDGNPTDPPQMTVYQLPDNGRTTSSN